MIKIRIIPDRIVEEYSYGKCMWLALALHDRYGWPIHAQIEKDGTVAHAYVKRQDGKEIDILGAQKAVDIFNEDGSTMKFSRHDFIQYLKKMNDGKDIELIYRREKSRADRIINLYRIGN